jgi:hypothetical protein
LIDEPVFLFNKPLSFYVKWSGTFFALLTVYLTSHDIVPLNKYIGTFTAVIWLWLGVIWKQPSMWILNIIMVALYIKGILGI